MNSPIFSLCRIVQKMGMTIGFANGCFDMLHDGHLHLLKSALKYCDVLFVGVNSDKSIKDLKGDSRPIKTIKERIADLEATDLCDGILVFETEEDLLELISEVRPDYLVKGADYRGKQITGEGQVRANGGVVIFVPLLPGVSTTALLQ